MSFFFVFDTLSISQNQVVTKKLKQKKTDKEKNLIVVGARGAGFFSEFFSIINHLAWAERAGKKIYAYWNKDFLYFVPIGYNNAKGNAWEFYFAPTVNIQNSNKRKFKIKSKIRRGIDAPDGSQFDIHSNNWVVSKATALKIREIIDRHISLKPPVAERINSFYRTHIQGKRTIGIHWRGTDKYQEIVIIPFAKIIAKANEFADETDQFLIASDQQNFLDYAQANLKKPVQYYPCFRSTNGQPIHLRYSKAKKGEDVLVEAILLSKCDLFIHTRSNVSAAVCCFNPHMSHIVVD